MKAAVLYELGTSPRYAEFPDPVPENDEQVLVTVKASSVKQLDKLKASGKHYTSYPYLPVVVGIDGIGILENGTPVYASGITGMMGEKALIQKDKWLAIPENLDINVAAALPNALMGAAIALLYRGGLQKGNTVLINGATGVTGKMAVQIAKYYGASAIIATGRNEESLQQLLKLGATGIIPLKQDDETIVKQLRELQNNTPVDIVIDYLWGHPIELVLSMFNGTRIQKVKIVTVGEMAGATIALSSGTLRSLPIELLGSGIGSLSAKDVMNYMNQILPDMFQLAAAGKLTVDVEPVDLKEVETVWLKDPAPGKRLVLTM